MDFKLTKVSRRELKAFLRLRHFTFSLQSAAVANQPFIHKNVKKALKDAIATQLLEPERMVIPLVKGQRISYKRSRIRFVSNLKNNYSAYAKKKLCRLISRKIWYNNFILNSFFNPEKANKDPSGKFQ